MSLFNIAPQHMFDPDFHRNATRNCSVMKLHNDIDTLFNNVMDGFFERVPLKKNQDLFIPRLNLYADDKQYIATCELPGVNPDEVTITVDDGQLVIRGEKKSEAAEKTKCFHSERAYGSFGRIVTLPDDADTEKISAASRYGVLTISIPKKSFTKGRSKQITIQQYA